MGATCSKKTTGEVHAEAPPPVAEVSTISASSAQLSESKKLVAPPDFQGPTTRRQCTDVLFALLLMAAWAAMTVLGVHVIQNGDYRLLTNPIDFNGNICGLDNTERGGIDMTDYEYLYPVNFYGGGK
jgi:hypothetical protein